MKRKSSNKSHILHRLRELSYNLWWSWNPAAQEIFEELSPHTWDVTNHNPVAVLAQFSEAELRARLGNEDFLSRLLNVLDAFDKYMSHPPAKLVSPLRGGKKSGVVAYFCAEFGFHECLPMYSGGLGILAGDHAKSASDLGLPFVGVGLFYRQGYFQQTIDPGGTQEEHYPYTNPALVPVERVVDAHGNAVVRSVEIGSLRVDFQAWMIKVGKSVIYLLDTDVPSNEEHVRGLTGLAYGGDATTRIRQEIVLGIGGVRLLAALGINPSVYHINEGHASFLTLELLRNELAAGRTFPEARNHVRQQCVFTTHTPVPAGHDKFPRDLFEFTMHPYAAAMNMSMEELVSFGQFHSQDRHGMFTMTILALNFSRAANAVSEIHGHISREMWRELYDTNDVRKVPIGHVTNGVHVPSWTTSASWNFWERHNSHKWKEFINDPKFWKHVTSPNIVSDEELWALRCELRRKLIEFIRRRASERRAHAGLGGEEPFQHLLSPDALTIGFARRFALYKRAQLIFHELGRIESLFNNPERPIQIVFAGKAHPRDEGGKHFIHEIIEFTRHPRFFGKVVFIENYDMNVARHLVAGCDVWLNTPRKPFEASGTSGQKIAINGGLHASILDGWWAEGYNKKNGWAIEGSDESMSPEEQDRRDAHALYELLQYEIAPLFYERGKDGLPGGWIERMRNAMRTIIPVFNTNRMLTEYISRYYFPPKS